MDILYNENRMKEKTKRWETNVGQRQKNQAEEKSKRKNKEPTKEKETWQKKRGR